MTGVQTCALPISYEDSRLQQIQEAYNAENEALKLALDKKKITQEQYNAEKEANDKELAQQQSFSIQEANLALNQAKLAAENDPTTLKNQKLLLEIEKTKQAIAQADITNPLEVEKL